MDAPKCKLCGVRHWSKCAGFAAATSDVPAPPRNFETYHSAWLQAHPWRTAAWLTSMLKEGFDIHHIDGNHGNDAPENLVLIEHSDHMMMHGGRTMGRLKRGPDTWGGEMINVVPTKQAKPENPEKPAFDRKAYQREYMRKIRNAGKPVRP